MSNQLIKETALGREQVFPKNYIQNLKDKDSGANLEDILKSFNMLFLSYLGNKIDTRKQVPMSLRHGGLWITYIVDNTIVTEWYDSTAVDDYTWGSDAYWREGSNMLVGDISISKQGTWVINGEDTGISPKGDKGDSPIIRIYNNKIQVSYDKGNTYTDLNNTPVFTLFRFNSNTNTHLVSYDLGQTWLDILPDKVYYKFKYNESTNTYQVSTDLGKTWSNVSADKVFYKFRFNPDTNTHQVSTDLGSNWIDISAEKVFYKFRTNENKLQVSTDLGTTWEDCSELIAAWFRWASGDTADSVGKILISRDEQKTWTDLSPNIVNNLRIKGYVATVGELPTSTAALGDIYMVGPTYDESDTTHDYPHYRMWVKLSSGWVDNGEYLSNVLVSQQFGNNSGAVISLKFITEQFSQLLQEQIQGGIYDVSAHNNGAVFESLSSLLNNANLSTLIPTSVRCGGMSIRFIQGSASNSDNKYVQFRLMSDSFNTTPSNWQGVDDIPTAGSNNLVKSGGVRNAINDIAQYFTNSDGNNFVIKDNTDVLNITDSEGNLILRINANGLNTTDVKLLIGSTLKSITELLNEKIDKNESIFTDYDKTTLYVTDGRGNVIAKVNNKGIDSININNTFLKGKNIFSLGDSLSTSGKWQNKLAEITGCIFNEELNYSQDNEYSFSWGGTQTGGGQKDGRSRAQKLVEYSAEHSVDVVFYQNINDINKVSNMGTFESVPFWRNQEITYSDIMSDYSTARNFFFNNISTVLSGVTPMAGTVINMQFDTTKANLKVTSTPTNNGNITLNVGENSYGIAITTSMTVSNIIEKILEYEYIGYSDVKGSDNISVDFKKDGGGSPVVSFVDTDNTGIDITISNIADTGIIPFAFKDLSIDDWLESAHWDDAWSVENLWSVYKALFEYLQRNLKNTKIFMLILNRLSYNASSPILRADGSLDYDAYYSNDYQTLINFQKEVARRYNIPVIDVSSESGLSVINIYPNYYPSNNVHPTDAGYERWGETIARLLVGK